MKKSLLFIAVAASSFAAFAYTWTGSANDGGLWTTPANWGVTSGYPKNTDDPIIFNGNAAVSLNTGAQTDIAYIKVTAGNVVITATSGSSLKINWPGYNNPSGVTGDRGISVADGASLDLSAPLETIDGRFDRIGTGKLTIRDIAVNKTGNANWYVFNGTNSFVGTASVTFPGTSDLVIGAGTPYDRSCLLINDSAQISTRNFDFSGGGATVPSTIAVQDGAESVVTASGKLILNCNTGLDTHCYTLKSGTLSASELSVIFQNTYRSPDYAPEHIHYAQEGGTSTFTTVTLSAGSAALRGGVMNLGNIANLTIGSGCTFGLEGGTLALTSSTLSKWDWPSGTYSISPGASVAIVGTSSLSIPSDCSTYDLGLEIGAGKTATVAAGATISAPLGSSSDWKVTINSGSVLKLASATARLDVPLDLTINGTGKINFTSHRGAAVAHRLVVDGVEKAKGRYNAGGNSFVDGTAQASILVPTAVWTGAGGDNLWSTAANWDSNTVPNGDTAIADVSQATSITLDQNVKLNALVAIPNGTERKVTITGTGTSITLHSTENYQCNLFVAKDCELVLDVDLKRDSSSLHCMFGGGRLSFKKGFPGCNSDAGMWPYLAIDGTMAIVGSNASVNDGTYKFLTAFSYGADGVILFEDGTTFTTERLWTGSAGMGLLKEFRQTGGNITLKTFYMNCGGSAGDGRPVYYLDGGSLSIFSGSAYNAINLNRPLSNEANEKSAGANWNGRKRFPGGSFEMSGGTLACGGFNGCYNQNFVRLYGGDVYLYGDGWAEFTYPSSIHGTNRNDYTFYLGGVTIHPKNAKRSIASGNVWLTGKNGNCTLDISEQEFQFGTGNSVAGPGGLVIEGSKTVYSYAAFTFTGDIAVKSGNLTCYSASSINGPRALIVESVGSVATFGNGGRFKRVELAQTANLAVSSGATLTTERLVVGKSYVPAGTYTGVYGAGTVVVTEAAPASWEVNGVGDLSWYADGTTTTVDSATTLSSLTYYPAATGETNSLTGAALTFADGANIYVAKGDTLVINNDVVFAGKITKTGWGEVVFNGAVTSAVTPAADTDNYWLTVTEGGATFDGAVTGVRLVTCGSIDASEPPVITLKENCTISNYAIVLTAWNTVSVACRGETHQEGATVDYSTTIFDDLISNRSNWALTNPQIGGYGRYVLDSGVFRSSNWFHLSFLFHAGVFGEFEFVQNGGTFILPQNFMFTRRLDRVKCTYTLNGGRFEFGGYLGGVSDPTKNILNLNGGTYVANASDVFSRESFTLTMSGTNTFEVASGKTLTIADDTTGSSSIVKTGAGTLVLDGAFGINSLDVPAGTVTIKDTILPLLDGSADLSIAKTAKLNLDNDGRATFKTLHVNGIERGAGVYSAAHEPSFMRNVLAGNGELQILEGNGPGILIIVR